MKKSPLNNEPTVNSSLTANVVGNQPKILENYDLSLLEEKLVVERHKQKVGEVIVRKIIETRTIHIPIRREKLIVEKTGGVGSNHLTEIDLGEEKVNEIKFSELGDTNDIYQVQSEFISLEVFKELVEKIAGQPNKENAKIRLEIITNNSESQKNYQDILMN